jgi:Family of unknown function (DUF5993)
MDTLIFLGIFVTFLAMRGRRRWLSLGLFFLSLITMLLLFYHHATSHLPLNF